MTNKRRKFIHGWRPDQHDGRDHLYMMIGKPAQLPPSIDLRGAMPAVYDQGQLGSCTGNAIAGAIDYANGPGGLMPSRLFIYYNERVKEGTVRQDAGAMIRDGIKSVNQLGVCPELDWPYDISKFKQKPPKAAFADALNKKVSSYARITSLQSMRTCLAYDNKPFVFGFAVYESFESQAVADSGRLEMPTPGERLLGGHAVLCVGYDDDSRRMIVRNSWGSSWGINGYFTMPYDYITNPKLADDMWAITL
jgi:C1A family cysteine protease